MRVATGSDWSIRLGLDSNLDSALLNARLGEGLREVYSDTVQQPLPPEFNQLLKQISDRPANVRGVALSDGLRKVTK
ncbi:NepR family anti-sigma factor [Methylobacterium sp. P31]